MNVSIMIEGQMGLNWPRWQRAAALAEELGFAGLYRSDHFTNAGGEDQDSLDLVPSLTWLATGTARIRFGQLVSPASFRDPVILARQMAAVSDLSGGRLVYGLGAGWQQREHEAFGYELGNISTRFARLQEALEVTTLLLRSAEPASFAGRFYRLQDAPMLPRPAYPIPICVGGNGAQRTLPLAARYGDVWNAVSLTPEQFAQKSARLDDLLGMIGRKPDEVRRTMMTGIYLGADLRERFTHHPVLAGQSHDEIVSALRARGALAGPVPQVAAGLVSLAEAGCEDVMLQWLWLDDLEGLHELSEVLT